jgi:multidrug efflux pump subunit AcrA (membrane-fusion protein)
MDPGEMAVVGKPIVTLNDTSQYEIVAHLRETLSQYIKKNTEVELKIGELETTGSISEIIPRIDPENRTFEVRISFSPKNKILIGSYARVFVPVGTEKRLLIPRQFVRRIGQISTVMVKNEKGVNTRYIRTGIEKGGWLEIRSGLKKGETVILGEKKQ